MDKVGVYNYFVCTFNLIISEKATVKISPLTGKPIVDFLPLFCRLIGRQARRERLLEGTSFVHPPTRCSLSFSLSLCEMLVRSFSNLETNLTEPPPFSYLPLGCWR